VSRRYLDDVGIPVKRTNIGRIGRTERSPLNRKIYEAILLGDRETARRLVRDNLAGKPKKERDKLQQSMRASVRIRHPLAMWGVTSRQDQTKFMAWARKTLPQSKFQTVQDMVRQYERTGRSAGLY
jgi:hypothetical protein